MTALLLALLFASASAAPVPFRPPHESQIPGGELGEAIRYGKRLVTQTPIFARAYVGNALSCSNCHLDAGLKPNAAPYVGVYASFPQFRARSGRVDTLQDRINDCFLRSENGMSLPDGSPEMRAMVAYVAWLSEGVPVGRRVEGQGFVKLIPRRPPDRAAGKELYASTCAACHGPDGQGQGTNPPLWGSRSFNIAAGMARLNTAASFIRWNMPLGQGGTLTDEQAFDVAAFVLDHPRPDFAAKDRDWPHGGKPQDSPY